MPRSLQLAKPFSSKKKAKMGGFQVSTCQWKRYLQVGKNILGLKTWTFYLMHKEIVDTGHGPHPKTRRVCYKAQHIPVHVQICSGSGFAPDHFIHTPPDFSSTPLCWNLLPTLHHFPLSTVPQNVAYWAASMSCLVLCPLDGLSHQGAM